MCTLTHTGFQRLEGDSAVGHSRRSHVLVQSKYGSVPEGTLSDQVTKPIRSLCHVFRGELKIMSSAGLTEACSVS